MIVGSRVARSSSGTEWEVEYPTMMNGRETRHIGFIRPRGHGASQFFGVNSDGSIYYYDFEPYEYVKRTVERVVRGVHAARGEG